MNRKKPLSHLQGGGMKRDLATRALTMSVAFRLTPKGCVPPTDRGPQYGSHDYRKILRQDCNPSSVQSPLSGRPASFRTSGVPAPSAPRGSGHAVNSGWPSCSFPMLSGGMARRLQPQPPHTSLAGLTPREYADRSEEGQNLNRADS